MTICIGAICDHGKTIVWVADTRLSLEHISSDAPFVKGWVVHPKWTALFSGNDITQVDPYLQSVRDALQEEREYTVAEVMAVFREQYQRYRLERVEQEVLGVYKLTMEQFLADGQQMFGEMGFRELQDRIEAIQVGCDFLVLGFDSNQRAHLFTVEHPGHVRTYTRVGVCAIGSGAPSAADSLMFHEYTPSLESERAVYLVCTAKFMAESASGVGKPMFVNVRTADGRVGLVSVERVKKIRKKWEAKGRARIPRDVETFMKAQIHWWRAE
jgi:20S proteasome alpha/beta subunit